MHTSYSWFKHVREKLCASFETRSYADLFDHMFEEVNEDKDVADKTRGVRRKCFQG